MSVTSLKAQRLLLKAKISRLESRLASARKSLKNATSAAKKKKYTDLVNARKSLLAKYNSDLDALNKEILRLSGGRYAPSHFHIGSKGLALIKESEGFFSKPYNDPVGYATVGYGHLIGYRGVTEADKKKWGTLTEKEATELLKKDLVSYENIVKKNITAHLNQNEFDALVSFVYNVGESGVNGSTLQKELNKNHRVNAANQLLRWNKAGGRELPGLTHRREAEKALFLSK